ncbi:hypothetical protein [Anoxybacteroides amylolyticum]|uniref:Uncharacterized protein n=1 Tax=Anoxybacteroides amylolyticum TaxID=294699 RepID=A0A167TM53_9BACL|nr:hypothetical protein [Anoxybacillus amylolyticus]ANB61424.1 hypothetical protein GFC30_2173 [Anoxybacillus amylolyticus]
MLRLFMFGRNRTLWNQWLRLTGQRNSRGMLWSLISFGLGIAATTAFNWRRQQMAQSTFKRPIRRAMRTINGFMNRRMRRPSLAAVELSKEIAEKPKIPTNNRS